MRASTAEVATIVPQTNDRLGEIALIAYDGKRGRLKHRRGLQARQALAKAPPQACRDTRVRGGFATITDPSASCRSPAYPRHARE